MAYCPHCGAEFYKLEFLETHLLSCQKSPFIKGHNADSATINTIKKGYKDKKGDFMYYWPPDYPKLEPEYRFCAVATGGPGKGVRSRLKAAGLQDWRFDWAHPDTKVAVEIDGNAWGVKGGGRHMQDDDLEKLDAAILLGWRVFRFSPGMLKVRGEEFAYKVLFAITDGLIKNAREFQQEALNNWLKYRDKHFWRNDYDV